MCMRAFLHSFQEAKKFARIVISGVSCASEANYLLIQAPPLPIHQVHSSGALDNEMCGAESSEKCTPLSLYVGSFNASSPPEHN